MSKQISGKNFSVHDKLKDHNSCWSYLKPADLHGDNDYEFCTILVGNIEHALYERQGSYFVLVDFFHCYEDACQEARTIIDKYPDVKHQLSHYSSRNLTGE